jgi:hypothetical protein
MANVGTIIARHVSSVYGQGCFLHSRDRAALLCEIRESLCLVHVRGEYLIEPSRQKDLRRNPLRATSVLEWREVLLKILDGDTCGYWSLVFGRSTRYGEVVLTSTRYREVVLTFVCITFAATYLIGNWQ